MAKYIRGRVMTSRAKNCTASGKPLTEVGSTAFPCPNCGFSIGRSPRCRDQGVSYVCVECGFVGP